MADFKPIYGNSYALIIGINSYNNPQFVPLGEAEEDADRLADLLEDEPHNFRVRRLLGQAATRQAILEALYDLRSAAEDDRVLVYFAGHGYTLSDRLGNEAGYLAAVDTEPDRDFTALELNRITDLRRHAGAKHIAFVFDACFSGQALGLTRSPAVATEAFLTRRAYQVISAGAGDQTVSDYNSMTDLIVDQLAPDNVRRGGIFTLSDLGLYLQQTMAQDSNQLQIPQFGHLSGSQGGELIFYSEKGPRLPTEIESALYASNAFVRQGAVSALIAMANADDPIRAELAQEWLDRLAANDPAENVREAAESYFEEREALEQGDQGRVDEARRKQEEAAAALDEATDEHPMVKAVAQIRDKVIRESQNKPVPTSDLVPDASTRQVPRIDDSHRAETVQGDQRLEFLTNLVSGDGGCTFSLTVRMLSALFVVGLIGAAVILGVGGGFTGTSDVAEATRTAGAVADVTSQPSPTSDGEESDEATSSVETREAPTAQANPTAITVSNVAALDVAQSVDLLAGNALTTLAFSPDGSDLIVGGNDQAEAGIGGRAAPLAAPFGSVAIYDWTIQSRIAVTQGDYSASVRQIHWTKAGIISLWFGIEDPTVYVLGLDPSTGTTTTLIADEWSLTTLSPLNESGEAIAGGAFGSLYVLLGEEVTDTYTLEDSASIADTAWAPESLNAAGVTETGRVFEWIPDSGRLIDYRTSGTTALTTMAYSPDAAVLAVGAEDGTVTLYNTTSRQPDSSFNHQRDRISDLMWSPDGTLLAVVTETEIAFYDTTRYSLVHEITLGTVVTRAGEGLAAWSPDSSTIAVINESGTVSLYQVKE